MKVGGGEWWDKQTFTGLLGQFGVRLFRTS